MKFNVMLNILIFIIIRLDQTKATLQLSTYPNSAIAGVEFNFNCMYDAPLVEIKMNNIPVCRIRGHLTGNICDIPGSHNQNFTYKCTASSYTVTIPGLFMTESLHGTNWKCLYIQQPSNMSNEIRLDMKVPITMVALLNMPPEENPVEVIDGENKDFTCRTDAGRPTSEIQWYLASINITSSATRQADVCATDCSDGKFISSSKLTYKGNKNDNGKKIVCTALNVVGYSVTSKERAIDVLYSPTTITITQSPDSPVKENETIILTCEIKGGNPVADIKWQCEGSTPVIASNTKVNNDTSLSSVRIQATKDNNKKVCTCIGSHPTWMPPNSTSLVLNILYAPANISITQIPHEPVIEGNNAILTCEILGGNPLATIIWICDGFAIISTTPGSTFDKVESTIELNVTKKDDGKACICRGQHPIWAENKDKRHVFTVYYAPERDPSIIEAPIGAVDEGTNITLTCEVLGGKPLAVISWQCNGSSPVSPTVSSLVDKTISSVILAVTRNQNGDNCICIGSHPAWKQYKSYSITLDVKYPPVEFLQIKQTPNGPIIENDTVSLTCEIFGGNPLADISWQCDGLKLVTTTGIKYTDKASSSIERNVTKHDNGKNCSCTGHHRLWLPENRKESHTFIVYYSSTVQITNTQPIKVVENRTKVLNCTDTDGNPRNATFVWYKSNTVIATTQTHSIRDAKARDAGFYTCKGSNGFGKQGESVVELNVLYSPRVSALHALYGSTVEENGTTLLQCTVQSNPPPNIVWIKHGSNEVLHSDGDLFQRNLTFDHLKCFDTSNYTCKAVNTIDRVDYTTMKNIELLVNCSPRRYEGDVDSNHLIGLAVGQNLKILDRIVAYPIGDITWFFKEDENSSETTIQSASNCSTYNIFDHEICFSRLNLTENDFGMYSAVVVNDIGNTKFNYKVNPQEKPYKSTNVNVSCGTLGAEVIWITAYNGGQQQTFYIVTIDKDGLHNMYSTGMFGKQKGVTKKHYLTMPAGRFSFDVFGNNTFGNATAKGYPCDVQGLEIKESVVGLAAGLGSGMGVVLVIIVAIVIFCRKRIAKKPDDGSKLFKRSEKKTNEEDDDELKDNPLYITSDVGNESVYSIVDKTKTTGCENSIAFRLGLQGSVYSEVNKTAKKALPAEDKNESRKKMPKKEQKGKHSKDIEMGNIYGNGQMILHDKNEDDVYANAENKSDSNTKKDNVVTHRKNKDGLIYADLELDPTPSGKKFVIRGLENRTNYAIIDLNVKVDPLPSDDDDDEDKEIKKD